jgi:CheY-like chemotaxis protein
MPDLSSRSILVVEDVYYIAMDAKDALERAGARVLGPFANEPSAMECLGREEPDCAVLDVNLGDGATFQLADAMESRSIPFVFFTGYDAKAIPPRFAHVARLEKPIQATQLVRTVKAQFGPT